SKRRRDGARSMTGFEIEELRFTPEAIRETRERLPRFSNWPVVYLIEDGHDIDVGETGSADRRMNQHLKSEQKQHLREVRIVFDDRFNGSACLDLESLLIRLLDGDGRYDLLNRNERSEEHTSELQSRENLVCRLLLEKKN